jgi:ATP dependent DNA ligase domain
MARGIARGHIDAISCTQLLEGKGARRSKGPSGAPCVFGAGTGPEALVVVSNGRYLAPVSMLPASFRRACPPKPNARRRSSCGCTKIKHDGFRVIARKDGAKVRLYSRPGNDLTYRFPLIGESLARLRSRSCITGGEAVACDENRRVRADPGATALTAPSARMELRTLWGIEVWACH